MIRLTLLLVCLSLILSGNSQAQSFENDLALLGQSQKVSTSAQSKKIRSWNPLSISYQLGIKFYQKAISEQLATSCAFELTCSRFSSAIVKDQGFLKGYFLTFDRLSRCSKISVMESLPIRLTKQGKIMETPADFHFH